MALSMLSISCSRLSKAISFSDTGMLASCSASMELLMSVASEGPEKRLWSASALAREVAREGAGWEGLLVLGVEFARDHFRRVDIWEWESIFGG